MAALQHVIPLRRANMRLRLQVAPQAEHDLELLLRQQNAVIESQDTTFSQVLSAHSFAVSTASHCFLTVTVCTSTTCSLCS